MSQHVPRIYLLIGEDEFAISEYLAVLESRLGDDTAASLNLTRVDGRSLDLQNLQAMAAAQPFLARRRLVILFHPTIRLDSKPVQDEFCQLLSTVPETTALVLVEYHFLTKAKDHRDGKLHWLENWAVAHPEIALFKVFPLPKPQDMREWIRNRAHKYSGQISSDAARLLENLVGSDKRLADQEIQKLLAYVNYQRTVESEDVERLVADAGQTDIFILVDALGTGDHARAMEMLQRLLDQQETAGIFGMVVRQFRLLLQAREIMDQGGGIREVASQLNIKPFVAEKIIAQARRFGISRLEEIHHRLLNADEAVKTGEIPANLSLEMLVVDLSRVGNL